MFAGNLLFYQTVLVKLFRLSGCEPYMLLCLLEGSLQVCLQAIRFFMLNNSGTVLLLVGG